ncbi:uncharacterized protein HD556DRAFT_1367800 [Suillus plorans]|uniref:Uncharacterized protein n=1 Tax=Suillus plorans TaxID=116603 RepID=A0A9P7ARC1_9AGAM|nr:uncharacterized protein HD556DRAFT_1367800 [Suillus plorans]KAG1794896.1 hypothetical protein HD556DRAFT_1367800 [Suillus plorans]
MFITTRFRFSLGFLFLLSIFVGVDVTGSIGYLYNSMMFPVEDYHRRQHSLVQLNRYHSFTGHTEFSGLLALTEHTMICNLIPYSHGPPNVLTKHLSTVACKKYSAFHILISA